MPKTKSDAKWFGLSPQQRDTLEHWLFDDGLSYNEALARAQSELGFTGSRSSLRRFFAAKHDERTILDLAQSASSAQAVATAPVNIAALRDAGLKVAAQIFFKQVTENPDDLKQWLPLAKLLTQSEKNESWRQVKDAENQIRRDALDFARTRFQYETIATAMRALPQLNELQEAQCDPKVRKFEEHKKINALRRGMFGDAIPELKPENEYEEAHPEVIEQRYQAAKRRQHEQWQREFQQRQRQNAELLKLQIARNDAIAEGRADDTDRGSMTRSASAQPHNPPIIPAAPAAGARSIAPPQTNEPTQPVPATEPTPEPFVDEPRKLTQEEREREYEELMRRARNLPR